MTQHSRSRTPEQRRQLEIVAGLGRGDVDALLELYDQLAPTLFGYSLAIARNRRRAIRALRQAFLEVWDAPVLLSDPRVPPLVAMAALVTHAVNQQAGQRRTTRAIRTAILKPPTFRVAS